MVNGRLSTCTKNVVLNNILINAKEGIWFIDDDNTSNRNIFTNCGPPFDFAAWQKKGFGKDSLTAKINVSLDLKNLKLTWSTPQELPLFEQLKLCPQDFHNNPWPTKKAPAGPFQYPNKTPTTINLREF
jgi:hypothetical protein